MTRRYAMVGAASGQPLTYQGRVLTHTDRAEMEFLFQGARVVEIGSQFPEQDCLPITQHPEMAHLTWPLRREDFT